MDRALSYRPWTSWRPRGEAREAEGEAVKFYFSGHSWGSALAMVLRETKRPMTTGELVEILQRDGFASVTTEMYAVARASLVRRAARQGDIKKVGTSLWTATASEAKKN